jgi:hypothetical protein
LARGDTFFSQQLAFWFVAALFIAVGLLFYALGRVIKPNKASRLRK